MNILLVGKFYSEGFALHISETLVSMGHSVKHFEPGFKSARFDGRFGHRVDQIYSMIHSSSDSLPVIRAHRMKYLWKVADQAHFDVVIICHDFLWPNEVSELKRRTGATIAMWFPDALVNFGKGFFMNAPYDALFFKDPYIVHMLTDVVASPVYYLPECFNPERHCLTKEEVSSEEYTCDITTAGNSHSWRVAIYKHLTEYDVKLWGMPPPLWMPSGPLEKMHQGRLVLNEDKVRAFLGAKIVLNNLHYGEIWGLNVRTFEAAGIGAFQMVDWRPGLAQLFDDKKELISFKGMSDLRKKVDYWLRHPDERQEIASAGKRRAHSEHTYRQRLSLLLDTLAQQANGFPVPQCKN